MSDQLPLAAPEPDLSDPDPVGGPAIAGPAAPRLTGAEELWLERGRTELARAKRLAERPGRVGKRDLLLHLDEAARSFAHLARSVRPS